MRKNRIVVPLLAGLVVLGCSRGEKVEVKVTLDGKPLAGASITLSQDTGGQAITGLTDSNGLATLTGARGSGVPAGTYKVVVAKTSGVAGAQEKIDPKMAKEMMMKTSTGGGPKSEIPSVYNNAKSTPLTLTVPPPSSPVALDLKSKP